MLRSAVVNTRNRLNLRMRWWIDLLERPYIKNSSSSLRRVSGILVSFAHGILYKIYYKEQI